ncbi:hypothetical protein SK128_019478 [Halocaridina rubra]|uniref:Uncharacterized protein n=1 Tax=Halocaridina rubra TaxID=373956 RepID=A0AAN8WL24_HALRR
MVSLACATVSAREACGLYSKNDDRTQGLSEGHNRKERLYRWLGQQKTIFPIGSSQPPPRGISSVSQFVPLSSSDSSSSATPRKTSSDPSAASSIPPSTSNRTHYSTGPSTASHTIHSSPSHISSSAKCSSRITQESVLAPSILKASSMPAVHSSHSLAASTGISHTSNHHDGLNQHSQSIRQQVQPLNPSSFPHHTQKPHIHQQHHPSHLMHQIPAPHSFHHPHMYPPQAPIHHHFPTHASHPSLFYPHLLTPMMPHYPVEQDFHQQPRKHKHKRKEGKKHRNRDASKEKKKKSKKMKKELTDEQIERTYTGLDREIAEEFIDLTMEPGISIQRALNHSFDQDSF